MQDALKYLKTADGVEIRNGAIIYVPGKWLAHCEKVHYDPRGILRSMYAGTVFPGGVVDPSLCYSTADAAEQAFKNGAIQ